MTTLYRPSYPGSKTFVGTPNFQVIYIIIVSGDKMNISAANVEVLNPSGLAEKGF
jgi:hypothetical protein